MRPRERMAARGEEYLSNAELLAILLGNGTRDLSATELAEQLLIQYQGLRFIKDLSFEELQNIKGIGLAKATRIKAAAELGRRLATSYNTKDRITCAEDVANHVMEEMRFLDREQFRCMYLDRKNQVLAVEIISIGGLAGTQVHPREVFKPAIKRSAASIILIHNHPSGDPQPSPEDIGVTRRMVEAGVLLGIEVLDHIIIGDGRFVSLKTQNLM